jgi:hypothetical protein
MKQWLIASITATALVTLLVWQHTRERAMATCIDAGGRWNGPKSSCERAPSRPLFRRDLQRS